MDSKLPMLFLIIRSAIFFLSACSSEFLLEYAGLTVVHFKAAGDGGMFAVRVVTCNMMMVGIQMWSLKFHEASVDRIAVAPGDVEQLDGVVVPPIGAAMINGNADGNVNAEQLGRLEGGHQIAADGIGGFREHR